MPLLDPARLHAERGQALFGARISAGIEMILAQRKLKILDLLFRRHHARLVALIQQPGPDHRGEDRDDHDHHQHFDQRDAGARIRSDVLP